MFRCPIVFKQENIKVEINEEFDALKNVEKVKNGNIKDIKVNTKHGFRNWIPVRCWQ